MPFDSLAMAAVADELRNTILGGRIQKILQPSEHAVALSVYAHGSSQWLVASADARHARVHLASGKLAKAFPTPSSFIMLLRKHLEGAHVTSVEQVPGERVLNLTASSKNSPAVLVIEAMGKHSNVILVSENRILGALKIVPPHLSRIRPIQVGREYAPPPPPPRDERLYPAGLRLDPVTDTNRVLELLSSCSPDAAIRSALQGLLAGTGPFLSEQIALYASVAPTSPLREVNIDVVVEAAIGLYRPVQVSGWLPWRFTDQRGHCDFAPYEPRGMREVFPEISMGHAIEVCIGESESRDGLSSTRNALLAEVTRAQRVARGKLDSLQEGMQAAQGAETLMQQGQLLLSYKHLVAPRATVLDLPDLGMAIPLDSARSAQENAERYFRRYRKLRDARSRLPPLISQAESAIAELDDTEAFVKLASTEADLSVVRRDIERGNADTTGPDNRRKPTRRGPLRFSFGHYVALVGRSARENDELTFRLAKREDLWLHARRRTGAHVILQSGSARLSDEVIAKAAQLTAYFSEGRADTAVEVDATQVRFVRKIPGAAPGRVTYKQARTFRVPPDLDGWQRSGN